MKPCHRFYRVSVQQQWQGIDRFIDDLIDGLPVSSTWLGEHISRYLAGMAGVSYANS